MTFRFNTYFNMWSSPVICWKSCAIQISLILRFCTIESSFTFNRWMSEQILFTWLSILNGYYFYHNTQTLATLVSPKHFNTLFLRFFFFLFLCTLNERRSIGVRFSHQSFTTRNLVVPDHHLVYLSVATVTKCSKKILFFSFFFSSFCDAENNISWQLTLSFRKKKIEFQFSASSLADNFCFCFGIFWNFAVSRF